MADKKVSVESIESALKLGSKYAGAVGFSVAPVNSESGGRPRWHYLSADGVRWVPCEEESAKLPSHRTPAKEVPALPGSKLGQWLLAFIDEEGDPIKPYVYIEPRRPSAEETGPEVMDAGRDGAVARPLDFNSLVLKLIERKDQAALEALSVAIQSLNACGQELQSLTALRREETERLREEKREAEQHRIEAIKANMELSQTLAELREEGQWARTVTELFKDHPQILVEGLKDLGVGLLDRLKGSG